MESERTRLREISDADTDHIIKWRNSSQVRDFFIFQGVLTPEIHRNWLRTKVETGDVVQFIIVEKATGRDVGTVYLRDIDRINQNAEFGIYIGELSARGKGLGKDAARLICRYGLEELALNHIYLRVLAGNSAAIHCYESVGFRSEGVLRQHCIKNGVFCDVALMGLLKPELV